MNNFLPADPQKPVRHLDQIELSRRWRMSPRSLERWRWQRIGPPYLKINGRVCYREVDILEYETSSLVDLVPSPIGSRGRRR